jgi:signal transduction histidine kinase
MAFHDLPIQKKLMRASLLISGMVLFVTCTTFFTYEFFKSRQEVKEKLETLGKIISANSTAALAFDNPTDAGEILSALKLEPHIESACLYNKEGILFAHYPDSVHLTSFPAKPAAEGYFFSQSFLDGFQPIVLGDKRLGTLYIKSDLTDIYDRFRLYFLITAGVIAVSFLLAYLLSVILQKNISVPVLALVETAKAISEHKDYSVRARKYNKDEVGLLIDAFNEMLVKIQEQNKTLSEFNTTLEQKVKTRTSELEIANKELESFSYSVSHDLRAPVRAINGFAAILERSHSGQLDKEGKEFLHTILREAGRMGHLIDDLLAFARLGKKEVQKTMVDMTTLAKETVDEFLKLNNENYTAKINVKTLAPALCDAVLVRQVFVNLISNALKFSHNKSDALVEIGSLEEGGVVSYYVKDNGVGFDMRYYNKLFGVFQRLHSYEEFNGTGIGLAIVHRIVTRHGGHVRAEGKINEGAVFYFSLSSLTPVNH